MNAMQVITPYAMNQIMLGIKTQLLLVPSPKIHLYQNNITPSPNSVISDFMEATYDGYAALTQAFAGGPYRLPDGSFAIASVASFNMTGSTTPNTIYGAYVTDNTSVNLLFALRFSNPVPMVDAFSHILLNNELAIPPNGLTGIGDPVP